MDFCNVAIETLAANVVKVWAGKVIVLFSYTEPVAAWIRDDEGNLSRYESTGAKFYGISPTMRRHLNKFGPGGETYDAGSPKPTLEKVSHARLCEIINAACPR